MPTVFSRALLQFSSFMTSLVRYFTAYPSISFIWTFRLMWMDWQMLENIVVGAILSSHGMNIPRCFSNSSVKTLFTRFLHCKATTYPLPNPGPEEEPLNRVLLRWWVKLCVSEREFVDLPPELELSVINTHLGKIHRCTLCLRYPSWDPIVF